MRTIIRELTELFAERRSAMVAAIIFVLGSALILAVQNAVVPLPTFLRAAVGGDYGRWSMTAALTHLLLIIAVSLFAGLSVAADIKKAPGKSNLFGGTRLVAVIIAALALIATARLAAGAGSALLQSITREFFVALILALVLVWRLRRITDSCRSEEIDATQPITPLRRRSSESWAVTALIIVFATNQILIGSASAALGKQNMMPSLTNLLGIRVASAQTIIMPMLNPDSQTTSLRAMPTISPVAAEPRGGDVVAAAMTVMIGKGAPEYAPSGISFDDAVGALAAWGKYASTIELSPELEARYKALTDVFTCNFCCGGPMNVTRNGRCGCAHAQAARGFFRYMLKNFGSAYSNDQLMGEAYRWQAIWYPAGVVEDYLLATGRGNVLGHKTHGGAGADGMHGLGQK